MTSLDIQVLNVSPSFAKDQTLFAGTFLSGNTGGVFKSIDGGNSWTKLQVATDFNPMVTAIEFSPAYERDQTLFVGQGFISNFIHKSTDGGNTWTTVNSTISANNIVLSANYLNDQTLFAGPDSDGFSMSTNGGRTWVTLNNGLLTFYFGDDLEITPKSPITLFAGSGGGIWQYTFTSAVSVEEANNSIIPVNFALKQNYPNPFNPTTTIEYQLPQRSEVILIIYNTLGQEVRALINQTVEAGFHKLVWDGRDNKGQHLPSRLYFYHLKVGSFIQGRKMVYLR